MYFFITLFISFFLAGCSINQLHEKKDIGEILPSQNIEQLLQKNYVQTVDYDAKEYLDNFYRPWNGDDEKNVLGNEVFWGYEDFVYGKGLLGENLLPIEKEWFLKIKEESQMQNLMSINQRAIMLTQESIRVFPTSRPIYYDIKYKGGTYPFDYLQNSTIHIYEPILISHYSKDKAWVFIQNSFAYGWVPSSSILLLDNKEEIIQKLIRSKKIVATKDYAPLYDEFGNFMGYAKQGALFSLSNEKENVFEIYGFKNGNLTILHIDKNFASNWPIVASKESYKALLENLLSEPYGWGGIHQRRDCSATTRDFFTPLGLWLPRNSSLQKEKGAYIDLSGFTPEQKEQYIINFAKPFQTLLWLKGHIMLYVGVNKDGRALVFHNIWGVKTIENKQESRYIIGKAVISDLWLGENLPNSIKNSLLIHRIKGMSILSK